MNDHCISPRQKRLFLYNLSIIQWLKMTKYMNVTGFNFQRYRNIIRFISVIFMFAFTASCALIGGTLKTSEDAQIRGVWLAQTESQNGHKRNVDYRYDFTGDILIFRDETGAKVNYPYILETENGLNFIAIRPEGAPANSPRIKVAYEIKGNTLILVIAPEGSTPTEISDKNDYELIVCKRMIP